MVGVRSSGGPGPEAKVYDALAAALEDPKGFGKRLREMAAETAKFENARDAAEKAIATADKAQKAALAAQEKAQTAMDAQARERADLEHARAALAADKHDFQAEAAGSRQEAINKTAELDAWEKRLAAQQAKLEESQDMARSALARAQAAEAEWTAKRDKLLAALG